MNVATYPERLAKCRALGISLGPEWDTEDPRDRIRLSAFLEVFLSDFVRPGVIYEIVLVHRVCETCGVSKPLERFTGLGHVCDLCAIGASAELVNDRTGKRIPLKAIEIPADCDTLND